MAGFKQEAIQPATFVTAGTSSVQLVAAKAGRSSLIVCNDHATNDVYLSLGTAAAVVGSGVALYAPGGSILLDNYRGAVQVIATGASTNVTVAEV